MAVLVALGTFVSTMAGGLIALHYRSHIRLIFGLTAGVMLGVVAFDLLPEVFELGGSSRVGVPVVMLCFAGGFLLLHLLERSIALHNAHEGSYGAHAHHVQVGTLSAVALAIHSLLDGVSLGLAAQVNGSTLLFVAIAVLGHDFADGMNTVSVMLAHDGTDRRTQLMLGLDATAPVIGAASTLLFTLPHSLLAGYLAVFAGALLYLATNDILPEAHAGRPSRVPLVLTFVGVLAMWGVVSAAGTAGL